jgi:hypothetical protein
MCRRPLIPSSNEEGLDQPLADPPSGSSLSLGPQQAHVLQQMDDALAVMLGHSARSGDGSSTTYDDDRSGFVGMYS